MTGRALLLCLIGIALATCSCGGSEACVLATVTWDGYQVPDDLNTLHFVLSDADGVFIERSYVLPNDAPPASLTLCRGPRTPERLDLAVVGYLDEIEVTRSTVKEVVLDGSVEEVALKLP